ncbi:MAG: hypothetical protein E7632_13635 [Ruminococcaceae bacterium]|nr:hypothetical protein [Oscillospiraceae bacterium]
MRAGTVLELGGIAGGAGMVSALENAKTLTADVNVADRLRKFDANAAVCCAEEVVPAAVGQLDFAIL